eukprot:10727753-Alexandrium_andersonii.AAC.1
MEARKLVLLHLHVAIVLLGHLLLVGPDPLVGRPRHAHMQLDIRGESKTNITHIAYEPSRKMIAGAPACLSVGW